MIRKTLRSNSEKIAAAPTKAVTDWNLLRSFCAIFETGTLTAAARISGVTQPSMGRHLRELEAAIGETLFVRLPGKLQPTARAEALFETLAPVRNAMRDAQSLFHETQGRVSGVVRVAVAHVYAMRVVPDILAPLLNAQPELEIELSVANRVDNLLRREADIAVRLMRPEQDSLIARKMGVTEMGLFAHETFIARFGEPKTFSLHPEAFIAGFDREPITITPAIRSGALSEPPRFRFRSDSMMARHAVVESGAGVGMYCVDIAATIPGLKRIFEKEVSLPLEVWLCAHDELKRSARMRLVWERLASELSARFSGT
jgi:DNA-binding transcriptional LysR family regulator